MVRRASELCFWCVNRPLAGNGVVGAVWSDEEAGMVPLPCKCPMWEMTLLSMWCSFRPRGCRRARSSTALLLHGYQAWRGWLSQRLMND